MMVPHTPGPWHVGQGNGEGHVFNESGRMRLGEHGGTTLYPICSVIDFEGERDANCRLIAAAPDLLAFAQAYVADLTEQVLALGWESIEEYRKHCKDNEPYPMAITAISKATKGGA